MANEGYIKLYRKMMKWGWYTDTNAKCVFLHLLFLAAYEPCFYRGVQLGPGQAVASIRQIATDTNISVKSVRVALEHLKTTQEVAQCSHGKFSIFTVNNYGEYQGEGTVEGKQRAHKGHSEGTDTDIKNLRSEEYKEKDIPKGISKEKCGEFANVMLSEVERSTLDDRLGDKGAADYIERLSAYLSQTGHRYKSHYATILNWWRKDGSPVSRSVRAQPIKPDKPRDIAGLTMEQIFGAEAD